MTRTGQKRKRILNQLAENSADELAELAMEIPMSVVPVPPCSASAGLPDQPLLET
jgi:hypothetical protein